MADQLERALEMGVTRSKNEQHLQSPLYIPQDPEWYADPEKLVNRQLAVMKDPEALSRSYLELLSRTHKFVEFLNHNMGNSDDWPMQLLAESEEAYNLFESLFSRIEVSVGMLTEV